MTGGSTNFGFSTKILKYEADVWTHVGDFQRARYLHSTVFNGNQLVIIGGIGSDFDNNDAT